MEAQVEDAPENSNAVLPQNSNDEKSPSPPPQDTKKSKKDDKKKDDKSVEQYIKSLNSLPSLEDKLGFVCKKYVQTVDDNKKLHYYVKQSDRRHGMLTKEKEHLQHEYNKTILVKSKLENLCRELQKQNKAIKEESLLKIREEEERRKETQAKFQNTLSEITTLLQQNNEKNAKLRDDNISMSEKFKSVVQQYQLREQQVDKMAKQMALESQLSDAKMQKASLEHQAENERLMAEMEQLKVVVAQYRAKIIELQGVETSLKGQLALYTDKYDEFQNALVKSNQVFGGFKEQMEMMSKKIKKLEKESLSWKKKFETSQTALLDMCGERQGSEERLASTTRQLQHMQSLCRTLQGERTVLLNSLKENNIERPPIPILPPAPPAPAPAPAPASNFKVDAMVANCAQIRQSLAHLQSQLNVLTNKNGPKEEQSKPEKTKKSKSKKSKAEKQAQRTDTETADVSKDLESDESTADKSNAKECDAKENSASNVDLESETNVDQTEITNYFNVEVPEDKLDEKTVESMIQALNMANINVSDLEMSSDDKNNIEISNSLDYSPEELKVQDLSEISVLTTVCKEEITDEEIEPAVQISDGLDTSPIEAISQIVEISSDKNEDP